MTEQQLREQVVKTARAWLGKKESDGTHKEIIDLYNSFRPLARNYAVKYTDAWCATFVSAVFIKLGYTGIAPLECSCEQMIALYKKIGAWQEDESVRPQIGDVVFYDWEDDGAGDNRGASDHVGIVAAVTGNTLTVIEGNYNNSVKERSIQVNGRYLRGYGLPAYKTLVSADTGTDDEAVWKFFKSKGLSDYAAAGIMGNLYAESGLKPTNLENAFEKTLGFTDDTYTKAVDSGAYPNFILDSAGYGIAQWTYRTRKQALLEYAKSTGASVGDLTMQLEFLWREIQGYTAVMNTLKTANSVLTASNAVLTEYEKPADMSIPVRTKRAEYGQRYYDKYAGRTEQPESVISDWAAEAWEWAKNSNLCDGTRPKDPATREEIMTQLFRFSKFIKV